MKKKNGFTLIELLVVIAIIALLIGILLPAIGKARDTAKNVLSQTRMRQLGQGASNYSADNQDRVFSYTWRANVEYMLPNGKPKKGNSDQEAASWQNTEILMRVTGRYDGPNKIVKFDGRLPHRRYSHIVLLDYLTNSQPEPIAASPFDKNLLNWQANPLDLTSANNIPYTSGSVQPGYEPATGWTDPGVRQRWPFASTYQTVPAAWNTDGINGQLTYIPHAASPHTFQGGDDIPLGNRKYTQVAFPSGKVLQFEEFDRFSARQALYFAYPEAQCNLSFFDGSVRRERTGEANPGWNPAQPNQIWQQRYIPLDTFPVPKTGLNEQDQYCQRYRWTRYGLRGIDYGGKEVGLPNGWDDSQTCN